MRKQYLHLSAYVCPNCSGPVIAGSLAVRENEISEETEIKQIGEICLACGLRPNFAGDLHRVREFAPIEWGLESPREDYDPATAAATLVRTAETGEPQFDLREVA
jgi:hypothetical protein